MSNFALPGMRDSSTSIFSYFRASDMVRATEVCRDWNCVIRATPHLNVVLILGRCKSILIKDQSLHRDFDFLNIVKFEVALDDISEAKRTANLMQHLFLRTQAQVVIAQREPRYIVEVKEGVEAIQDGATQVKSLLAVAEFEPSYLNQVKAKVAQMSRPPGIVDEGLLGIVELEVKRDPHEASITAGLIEAESYRDAALLLVGEAQARRKDFEGAEVTLSRIESPGVQDQLVYRIDALQQASLKRPQARTRCYRPKSILLETVSKAEALKDRLTNRV